MVRCEREIDGKQCGGMIAIPPGEKGVCPKCGRVCGLADSRLVQGDLRNKMGGTK